MVSIASMDASSDAVAGRPKCGCRKGGHFLSKTYRVKRGTYGHGCRGRSRDITKNFSMGARWRYLGGYEPEMLGREGRMMVVECIKSPVSN